MFETITCPQCGCSCRARAGGGTCQQCFTPFRVDCSRCGQVGAVAYGVCDPCREQDRKPQGEAVRLFEPAPAQIPGQLSL